MSGRSPGLWVTKYTPTPLDRISRTSCSIFCTNTLGASRNSIWASSKKNNSFGLSRSPASGRRSNSSDSIHSRKTAYSLGLRESFTQSSRLMIPRPCPSVRIQSWMSRAGSPKNRSPPWVSRGDSARRMPCSVTGATAPYSALNSARFSPTNCRVVRRSFKSSSSRPWSSAMRNTRFSTDSWAAVRPRIRDSRSGPMSDTVARTGWPASWNTSQNTTG